MSTPPALACDAENLHTDALPAPRRALRVAMVTETYPPEINGVAMTVARLVQGLHQRGHDLQLIRPRHCRAEVAVAAGAEPGADRAGIQQLLMKGLPIPRYPQLKMGLPARRALVRHWSLHRPDVVHIATEGPLGWSALQAALQLKLPVTSDFRTNFHAYSQHYGIGWLKRPILGYLRKFHNRTACTMVPTEALRRELTAEGFRDVQVVARGVDTQAFHPGARSDALRAQWGVQAGTRVVACVGRLASEKNLGLLVEAFEAMQRQRPDSKLLFVGDGPLREALQLRCPQAVFAGNRRGEDLAAHYASADCFACPSVTETYGNVTPEAMASGLPVLAFGYAAAGRLIRDGHNGLLAATHDAPAFIRQAVRLATDDALLLRLGSAARETALAQQWEVVVAQVETLLKRALHRAPVLSALDIRYAGPSAG